MTAARPPGSDGKGRDAGWSITARANVSRARRAGKVTLPAMKFLDKPTAMLIVNWIKCRRL